MAKTVIAGFHAMEETLKSGAAVSGELLYYKKSPRIEEIIALAEKRGVPVRRVGRDTLEKRAGGHEVRGALLIVEAVASPTRLKEYHEYLEDFDRRQEALVLLLDEITDPQNLGAILRSADLFNVDLVVIPQRRSAHETAAVRAASAGASAYVPIVTVPNLARAMEELKQAGFWIYGAQAGGEAAEKTGLSGKLALVMGSEGKGLRRLVSEGCDGFVSIPMGGHIDSLNVSVAAGILLYEVRRQGRDSRAGD